jgi:hypothetical protein
LTEVVILTEAEAVAGNTRIINTVPTVECVTVLRTWIFELQKFDPSKRFFRRLGSFILPPKAILITFDITEYLKFVFLIFEFLIVKVREI